MQASTGCEPSGSPISWANAPDWGGPMNAYSSSTGRGAWPWAASAPLRQREIAARESTSTPSRSKITAVPSNFSAFSWRALGAAAEHVGMSPDRASLGRERLAARAARISLLRRRVVAAVLATFVLAWGAIAWDGAMGKETTAATAQVPTSSDSTTSSSSSSSDDSTGSSSSDDSSSSSVPPLTTSQS